MANIALAVLESALRDKKLDRTLTTALPPLEQSPEACAQTGVAAVDACLRNGVPRGQLSEVNSRLATWKAAASTSPHITYWRSADEWACPCS